MTRHPWNTLVLLASVLGFFAMQSHAGVLPTSAQVTAEGDHYRYTYGVVVTSDSILRPGDFFTINDFAGLTPSSNIQPAGFSFSTSPTGGNPVGTVPGDDPNLPNLTWTYTGTDPLTGPTAAMTFSVLSNSNYTAPGAFTARTHTAADGITDSNITTTTVAIANPNPTPTPTPGVPEPATLALLAAGFPIALVARRWNKVKA